MTTGASMLRPRVDWYFDFISPFSYLQNTQLGRIERLATVRRMPILFAGLLEHWGHVGPAEIPPKRTWTFAHCAWIAQRLGVRFAMPSMHPFNPLPLLRLSLALDDTREVVDRLFAWVWQEGHVPSEAEAWGALLDELDVEPARLADETVKARLRTNGEQAIAAGVFGVPTAVVGNHPFWGYDATDMLVDHLEGAPTVDEAMRRARDLPAGPGRRRFQDTSDGKR